MESVFIDHNITGSKNQLTRPTDMEICKVSQTSSELSDFVHIEHKIVEIEEGLESCRIMIVKEDGRSKAETAIESRTKNEVEGKHPELSDSSSTDESLDDDMTDLDVEVGEVDMGHILEVERAEGQEANGILRQYEQGNFSGGATLDTQDHDQKSANASPPTNEALHFPPGLKICRNPFFSTPCEATEFTSYTEIPKINGVEVRMTEVDLTDAEAKFYSDQVFGYWRVRILSPLRKCWTPRKVTDGD